MILTAHQSYILSKSQYMSLLFLAPALLEKLYLVLHDLHQLLQGLPLLVRDLE